MRQLLYISTATSLAPGDEVATILVSSRRNNSRDSLSGLLWTDGTRFLQVLEGEAHQVEAAFERIRRDPRHRAVVVLHDREVECRTFGSWSMALLDDSDGRISEALVNADPTVRATFEGLVRERRAAA